MLEFLIEKPPVPAVPNAVQIESNHGIPPASRKTISRIVIAK